MSKEILKEQEGTFEDLVQEIFAELLEKKFKFNGGKNE